jgi:hypothetical protein
MFYHASLEEFGNAKRMRELINMPISYDEGKQAFYQAPRRDHETQMADRSLLGNSLASVFTDC